MTGVPGSESSRANMSSMRRRLWLSRRASRGGGAGGAEQRGQPAADAEVDARLVVQGIDAIHVIALLVGDHLQRQFVVVAQEQRPLAVGGNGRGLLQDVNDGEAVF